MRMFLAAVGGLILTLSQVAVAAEPGQAGGAAPPPAAPGKVPGAAPAAAPGKKVQADAPRAPLGKVQAWRTLNSSLSGGYAFIDRLELTEEQEKVLDEMAAAVSKKTMTAYGVANAKVPQLQGDDAKDLEKARAQSIKWNEAYKEAQGQVSTEEVANLLTPDQLGKILEINALVLGWNKWLDEYMATYEKKLDEALGPVPQDAAARKAMAAKYWILESYMKGAGALACRLALTKEQEAALDELVKKSAEESMALSGPAGGMFRRGAGGGNHDMWSLRNIVTGQARAAVGEKNREAVEKVLTDDQRGRLAKCVPLIAARDKDVWQSYSETVAKIDKILPPPKNKAGGVGSPYYGPGAGGAWKW